MKSSRKPNETHNLDKASMSLSIPHDVYKALHQRAQTVLQVGVPNNSIQYGHERLFSSRESEKFQNMKHPPLHNRNSIRMPTGASRPI